MVGQVRDVARAAARRVSRRQAFRLIATGLAGAAVATYVSQTDILAAVPGVVSSANVLAPAVDVQHQAPRSGPHGPHTPRNGAGTTQHGAASNQTSPNQRNAGQSGTNRAGVSSGGPNGSSGAHWFDQARAGSNPSSAWINPSAPKPNQRGGWFNSANPPANLPKPPAAQH